MATFARPDLCPDCGAVLPTDPVSCPRCGLPLRHPLAVELLATLGRADDLLRRLRATAVVPASTGAPVLDPGRTAPAAEPVRRGAGLGQSSVPRLLLTLGAACLLVAAVVFLAVAWSSLGVAGRTAVLLALTGSAAAASVALGRRGLGAAAEALGAVTLGLVVLDVLGAAQAGWAPDLGSAGFGIVLGAALGAAGLGLSALHRTLGGQDPVVPQLVPGPALLVVAGAVGALDPGSAIELAWAGAVLAAAGLVALGARTGLSVLRIAAAVAGLVAWLVLVVVVVAENGDRMSLARWWAHGGAAWMLAASALGLLPLLEPSVRAHRLAAVPAAAAAAGVSLTVVFAALDEGADVVLVVTASTVAVWSLVALVRPRWRPVAAGPGIAFAGPAVAAVLVLSGAAAEALLRVGEPYSVSGAVRVDGSAPIWDARLLVVAVLALVLLVLGLVRSAWRRRVALAGLGLLGLAVLGAGALEGAPLGVLLLPVLAAGLALVVVRTSLGATHGADVGVVVGVVVGGAAAALALPSAVLAASAWTALALALGWRLARDVGRPVRPGPRWPLVPALALPAALAAALWSAGEVVGLDVSVRGGVVLILLGVLAVVVRQDAVDVSVVLVAPWAGAVGVLAADDVSVSLAVHLTLAGALVVVRALTDPRRRPAAWAGGLLLAAATWVRLGDLGVEAPEAYTGPTALVLLVVGWRVLRATPAASSQATLLPGLVLAVLPSLLWVLAGDPVSWRALLLGGGCLLLVLGGARVGWQAPLVVGAVAGALLVLRELAPYAAATPQWVLLAVAGLLLTVVGISWERRVRDLRVAGGYLARLR
ncbi:hypothetical protein I601_3379 [Nocardioides dokdonensis FR1436]|uniref:Uncharacterized protein n=1 Tax=Nocardioides dokdonensis FR1436 TaxID=1300347 RepID=A0A1A9GQR5_9ACTN|nr:zinc ribbon domain-containing protein [Nocardioides dokdonensis]ANH39785.1 hypothetical protein I601_3379 [Nocardioides dokdonensis FR1436]